MTICHINCKIKRDDKEELVENRVIEFCSAIVERESFSLYSTISGFFKEYGYTDGYINTLQAIYDVSGNNSYLLSIGDYFRDIGQKEIAFSYYNKCFKAQNPKLYERFEQTKPSVYFSQDFRTQYGNDTKLIKLVDKNVVLTHILKLALDYGLREQVVLLAEYIFTIAERINQHLMSKNFGYKNVFELQEIVDDYNFLSNELSKIKHHNAINNLAIRLNPNNKLAHFNIMDDIIVYGNPQDALEYYNTVFRNRFIELEAKSLYQLYSAFEGFYRSIQDYYKTAYYQKLLIEERFKS